MRRDREVPGVRIICFVVFLAFTLCWLFMQRELLVCAICHLSRTKETISRFSFLYVSVLLICILLLAVPISRMLFKYRNGQHACNYAVSAFLLGCMTGFDGEHFFSRDTTVWITGASLLALVLIVPKIVSFLNRPASYNNASRTIASNLMILSVLFCITAVTGNTDENLHRRLRIENLVSKGDFAKALKVGVDEEETDPAITLLRVKAMLGMDSAEPGSGTGEHLFRYPISDIRALTDSLTVLERDSVYDCRTVQIALAMLDMDIQRADSLISPLIPEGKIPLYYMQLLVLSENSEAAALLPDEFEAERKRYGSFNETLDQLRNEPAQVRANGTFIAFHDSYYWFCTFCRK
ncbi:MAG: hypothetical protein J5869_03920 [Bacteroidaceae bacterium]|nr:hypothetical protein [Bacteroidaceae bacterium]